jgi:hypothetical protein
MVRIITLQDDAWYGWCERWSFCFLFHLGDVPSCPPTNLAAALAQPTLPPPSHTLAHPTILYIPMDLRH